MTLDTFQAGAAVVLALAYAASIAGARSPRRRLAEIALLALAGIAGEQSCITMYAFYEYAPGWLGRVGDVPPLVPLIWPLVILSAREVRDALRVPGEPPPAPLAGALSVAALVTLDASLMEALSVAAGFWRWAEPGYLGVPLIGILGWGCFALGAAWALDRAEDAEARGAGLGRLLLLPPAALLSTHAGLLALWWGALRWGPRGDLGPWAVLGFAPLALLAAGLVLARRRAGAPGLALGTTAPRVVASALFFALLFSLGGPPERPLLYAHTALVALPYLVAARWSMARHADLPDRQI